MWSDLAEEDATYNEEVNDIFDTSIVNSSTVTKDKHIDAENKFNKLKIHNIEHIKEENSSDDSDIDSSDGTVNRTMLAKSPGSGGINNTIDTSLNQDNEERGGNGRYESGNDVGTDESQNSIGEQSKNKCNDLAPADPTNENLSTMAMIKLLKKQEEKNGVTLNDNFKRITNVSNSQREMIVQTINDYLKEERTAIVTNVDDDQCLSGCVNSEIDGYDAEDEFFQSREWFGETKFKMIIESRHIRALYYFEKVRYAKIEQYVEDKFQSLHKSLIRRVIDSPMTCEVTAFIDLITTEY